MRVAATQFSLRPIASAQEFWARVERLTAEAAAQGCTAIVFPEYFSLALATAAPYTGSFQERLGALAADHKDFLKRLRALAAAKKIHIIAGTIPYKVSSKQIRNRCYVIPPAGKAIAQDKVMMTRFEDEEWKIQGGPRTLMAFRIGSVPCAVLTCYDVEFPRLAAAAAKKKIFLIFVPSCTDDVHGYWRVRLCAQARTVENQCFAAMASIVEGHPDYPEINAHHGRGGIFTPSDVGFPEGGVAAEGELNKEGICVADIDLALLKQVRKSGTVLNLRDQS